jgi:NADH-quinone oxidoreductase subunit L
MGLLVWLIPAIPGLSALVLILFGRILPRRYVAVQACASVAFSFGSGLLAIFGLGRFSADRLPFLRSLMSWIDVGRVQVSLSFQFDALSSVMILVVTGVGFLIHVYSVGYMAKERDFSRYFAYLNLFIFSMLVLVLASNLIMMFIGWEGVGLCSYLLIGFWYEKPSAAKAGQKAFILNRIGDAGFILGILFVLLSIGSSEFESINKAVANGVWTPGSATLIALLLFVGAIGKSAQIPLYVWLPDAMEGPTPVSALIHAATMVTAGVYLVARMNNLYAFSGTAASVVAVIGALTAVFAATMALTQNDIKRVLAYSTVSQLGYMFIGCGIGAVSAGIFHLVTHAFFKSLLFLCAGSVIHAISGEQDLRHMGGLRRFLPRTYGPFLVGAMAIAGVPFFSGFFSKDAILSGAFARHRYFIWVLGIAAAVLTAFYIFRLIFLTFHGDLRLAPEKIQHVHESPPVMTVPLAILAFLAVFAGFLGLPAILGEKANVFGRFLETVLPAVQGRVFGPRSEWFVILSSTAAAALGIAGAYVFYITRTALPHSFIARFPKLYSLLYQNYYVDEVYDATIVQPLIKGSELVYRRFDLGVIDKTVDASGAAAHVFGLGLSALQTGYLKDYALAFLLGVAIFLGVLVF